MKSLLGLFVIFALASPACVGTQLLHRCPGPCGEGNLCDATVGECKKDPCDHRCNQQSQICEAGPPPRCVDRNMGEAQESGPPGSLSNE